MFRSLSFGFFTAFVLAAPMARAELPRPLDENHTRRLVTEAVREREPGAEITADTRGANTRLTLPDGRVLRLETDELHRLLRAEPDGGKREEILAGFLSQLLGKPAQSAPPPSTEKPRPAGNWKSAPKAGGKVEIATPVPQPVAEPVAAPAPKPDRRPRTLRALIDRDGAQFSLWPMDGDMIVNGSPFDPYTEIRPFQAAPGILKLGSPFLYPVWSGQDLQESGYDRAQLVQNWLRELDDPKNIYEEDTLPGTRIRRLRGENAALMMLSLRMWGHVPEGGGKIVAAAPAANVLLWIDSPDPAEIERLRRAAKDHYERQWMTRRGPTAGLSPRELSTELAEFAGIKTWSEPGWSGPQFWRSPYWQPYEETGAD